MQGEIEAALASALDSTRRRGAVRGTAPTPNSMDLYFRGMASFDKGLHLNTFASA